MTGVAWLSSGRLPGPWIPSRFRGNDTVDVSRRSVLDHRFVTWSSLWPFATHDVKPALSFPRIGRREETPVAGDGLWRESSKAASAAARLCTTRDARGRGSGFAKGSSPAAACAHKKKRPRGAKLGGAFWSSSCEDFPYMRSFVEALGAWPSCPQASRSFKLSAAGKRPKRSGPVPMP
jgi:hypothetical protein